MNHGVKIVVRALAILLSICVPKVGIAQRPSTPPRGHDVKGFEPITVTQQVPPVAISQRMPNWCWAACVEMTLRSAGIPVTQEQIVIAKYGRLVNLPSFDLQSIAQAITMSASGQEVKVSGTVMPRPMSPTEVVAAIDRDNPIIAATTAAPWLPESHVIMVVGYQFDLVGNLFIKVFDPMPNTGGIRTVPYANSTGFWRQTVTVAIDRKVKEATRDEAIQGDQKLDPAIASKIEDLQDEISDLNDEIEYERKTIETDDEQIARREAALEMAVEKGVLPTERIYREIQQQIDDLKADRRASQRAITNKQRELRTKESELNRLLRP